MIKSFLISYAVCAVSFVTLYIAIEAFTKLNRFVPGGRSSFFEIVTTFFGNLARYHSAMVPTIFANYMGPILTLSAAMFSLTFLNRGNEFTPVKAAGISIYRMLVPIFALALTFSGVTFVLQDWVIPELREPIRQALSLSRSDALQPDPFYDPIHNLHIKIERYDPFQKVAEGVIIENWNLTSDRDSEQVNTFLDAQTMVWYQDADSTPKHETGRWVVRDGSIQRYKAGWRGELIYNTEGSDFYRLKEPFDEKHLDTSLLPIDLETSDQDISYLSSAELISQYQRQPYHRHLLARLHHHFAFPLSHVILLLLGIPFVLNSRNRSFFLSLAVSFILCAGYFLVSSMALSLASDPGEHALPPILASWLPNVLFGSLGLTIFVNMRT
jgi:lipopolysaccharide export LptBFGC system permease protein LptF